MAPTGICERQTYSMSVYLHMYKKAVRLITVAPREALKSPDHRLKEAVKETRSFSVKMFVSR